MSLPTDPIRHLIIDAARGNSVPLWTSPPYLFRPEEVLEALVLTESSGNIRARRYEPGHDRAGRRDQAQDRDVPGQDDGELEDDASYGLTQVLGSNLSKYWPDLWGGRRRAVPDEPKLAAFKLAGGEGADSPVPPLSFGWALVAEVNLDAGCWVLGAELRGLALEEKDVDGRLFWHQGAGALLGIPGEPYVEVPTIERALARYNGGPTGDDVLISTGTGFGDMRLRAYVERVRAFAAQVRQEVGS